MKFRTGFGQVASFALTAVTATLAAGCALPTEQAGDGVERSAESLGKRIYLVPVDARARVACRAEDNRYYCSQAAADAARVRCAAKVLAAGATAGDPCATGGDACVRTQRSDEPCSADGETYPTVASCDHPHPDNCSWYSACLEGKHPCVEDGYALGYGERYCNAFANNAGFSAAGRRWVASTMLCLQNHLATLPASTLRAMTCSALTDDAFASHPACYTQAGASICDLGPSDALQVLHTISAADLLSSRALKQEASVVRTCIGHVFGRLFSADAPAAAGPTVVASPALNELERAELVERYQFWTQMDLELQSRLAATGE